MAVYDNLPERSRKAINYIQTFTEKEKGLIHRALDGVSEAEKAWVNSQGFLKNVVEDLTPQLGGDLDVNDNAITNANGNIEILVPGDDGLVITGTPTSGTPYLDVDLDGPVQLTTASNIVLDYGQDLYIQKNGANTMAWPFDTPADGDVLTWNTGGQLSWEPGGGGGGSSTFTGLTDTPGALGTAGQLVRVNGGATALEFFSEDFLSNVSEDTTPQLGGNLDVNGNSIVSAGGADISITPDGAGAIVLDSLRWPTTDGSADQVLKTDGSGNLSWVANAGSGLANVVDDTTPQLGGNLDVNGNSIVSIANGDIAITPNGTGNVVLDGLNWPQADGTNGQILQTNGAGQLGWTSAGAGSSTFLGLSDTPGSFSASQWVRANSGATALEFVSPPVQSITASGALNKSGTTAVTLTIDAASGSGPGTMSSADFTKLAGIETGADVTDATNVAAAGAVMDSDFSGSSGYLYKTGAGAYSLRQITAQSGGTASGGSDGDIILIY